MAKITAQQLREKYLNFFQSKNHTIIPSASLVPADDPSILFTTAGMHPLVPFLMGEKHPGGSRVVNAQKCVRTGDIDEVGDNTHLTFFEMLGNWSFGDYFKKEAIEWSWEFLTSAKHLNLDKNRLAFSVFAGDEDAPRDEESAQIWESLGVAKHRLAFLPKKNNWWIAGETGPCGPDTEMFFWTDAGSEPALPFQDHYEDPRWVEIWNDVFMQYNKTAGGKYEPLEQKNVDTGMGLDRVLAVLNGQTSVYDTELFKPMFDVIGLRNEILSGGEVAKARIILDHIRASVFITADGVEPSNKDRGYVLRRLLRRAMVYARVLNLQATWLKALIGQVITVYASAYPQLVENSNKIFEIIESEQAKFGKTLEKGLREFRKLVSDEDGLTGKEAFDLYQTYGFPWELTRELMAGEGKEVIKEEFEQEFKKHQELSRTASAGQFKGGLASHSKKIIRLHTVTHLMNAALREVLGKDVWQKGSNITEERTRFDFTHGRKMTPEEITAVEELVNGWIKRDLKVKKEIMPLEEAKKLEAIGVFGEKYADEVSIYSVYDPSTDEIISREFCGGPHVEHTSTIGNFKIKKEEASSSGVRRIKAIVE
ncbi:MAG: alanine--tRNA ligase [Candidatus Doudnabacteria bacterium CG10_big_fil_rev_8_21_14_0_10_42_18]|uniref:Alanine--tRNA ligase n=1 Tax=Candidatus Doudnabacteria bacterium CG10_big_fil_rev_8_21_14_0_10_42_18 TaxID=1974552 RepID=A0A2H0VAI1_9BACT|nr:MAG: alanine--tRNA ligase [Candidatus Doudnabacteria bacterium CG10_big_fil_rev_8_21_14_0_10_42_18]